MLDPKFRDPDRVRAVGTCETVVTALQKQLAGRATPVVHLSTNSAETVTAMDTFQFFEDECDQPTKTNPIPIFRDERNLPKRVAGLELSGVQHYPDPAVGVSVTFKGPGTLATVYLYNLGLAEVSTDVKSAQLLEVFQRSYAESTSRRRPAQCEL